MSEILTKMEKFILRIEAEYGLDNHEGIRLAVSQLRRADVNEMAYRWVVRCITHQQREKTLAAERAATVSDMHETPQGLGGRRNPRWTPEDQAQIERREAEYQAEYQARERKSWDAINRAFEDLKNVWRVQWTNELLEAQFAMPDGQKTTWGDATIEQHEIRLEMFKSNVTANMEGAARHQQAIEDLTAAGVSTLSELHPDYSRVER